MIGAAGPSAEKPDSARIPESSRRRSAFSHRPVRPGMLGHWYAVPSVIIGLLFTLGPVGVIVAFFNPFDTMLKYFEFPLLHTCKHHHQACFYAV